MTFSRLDLLCGVVDNYGDAGVVYRLARALSDRSPSLCLRLVVDDLAAFASIAPGIDPADSLQSRGGWTVVRWDHPGDRSLSLFRAAPPEVVLECFAAGRPDWYEEILFDPSNPSRRHIVDLEYLSAESFTQDYHRLPSLTRSPLVGKSIFMPGFTPGTGGLILDRAFSEAKALASDPASRPAFRASVLEELDSSDLASRFLVLAFTYERDFTALVRDLAAFGWERPVAVLAAAGKSQGPFLAACEAAGTPFPVVRLPFLSQTDWDRLLLAVDFAIVRGEDSFSRAALTGRPFLWQAYPQDERHHLVKVEAFLDVLRRAATSSVPEGRSQGGLPEKCSYAQAELPEICGEESCRSPSSVPEAPTAEPPLPALEALYRALNDREADTTATTGKELLLPVLRSYDALIPAFESLSARLFSLGDLASNLLTYLASLP